MSKIDNLYQLSLMKDKKIEQNNTIHLIQKESNSSDKKRLNNQDQEKNLTKNPLLQPNITVKKEKKEKKEEKEEKEEKIVQTNKINLKIKESNQTLKKEKEEKEIIKEQEKEKIKKAKEVVKKDIHFKMIKEGNDILISGILSSKDDYLNLKKYYQNLKSNSLTFDSKRVNPKVLSTVIALKNIADKFISGYMEYSNHILNIDGVVKTKEDKDTILFTLANIKDLRVKAHIVIEEPKTKEKHIKKIIISKVGENIKISGTFGSMDGLNKLVKLFKSSGLKVKKELCVIDSDMKDDRWKIPLYAIKDNFLKFIKGSIQFDKDIFYINGETTLEGLEDNISNILQNNSNGLKIDENITYTPPKKVMQRIQEKVNSILRLKHIRFKKGTDELIEESKVVLDEILQTLKLLPNLKVEIRGYTDSDGSKSANLILSQKRANSVKKYLVEHGIKAENLIAKGFGEENPIVENSSKENKQINRRVEFKILGE